MSSQQPSPPRNNDNEFMSNFSLSLIHKILLTDPVDFPELTMNGLPKAKQMYFHAFVKNRGFPITLIDEESDDSNSNSINNNNNNNTQLSSMEEQISKTMYRAYNDMILNEMEQSQHSYKPLQNILLETYTMLRALIPNRPDLHSFLKDEDVMNCPLDSFNKISNCLKRVGEALSNLESEYRFESTKQWLDILSVAMKNHTDKFGNHKDGVDDEDSGVNHENESCTLFLQEKNEQIQILKYVPPVDLLGSEHEGYDNGNSDNHKWSISYTSFALASATYLHYKAELCQAETADFQLGHILAPRIHKLGKEHIFLKFQEKYRSRSPPTSSDEVIESKVQDVDIDIGPDVQVHVPNTKMWIDEMVKQTSYTPEELLASEEKRGQVMLQTGWVDNLLFRSPRTINEEEENEETTKLNENSPITVSTSSPFLMPEVLWLDTRTIRDIRMTTKISVVGSVLALHAASAAGVSDSVFKRDPLDSIIEDCRLKLTAAMNDRNVASQEIFETNIGNAVVDLAKALNPTIMESEITQSLLNRTKATLKGEDPVIKLLDNRMRKIFRELLVSNPKNHQQVPTSIKSGRTLSFNRNLVEGNNDISFDSLFKKVAKQEFVSKGFSFYSDELAKASLLACRTINLTLSIHGEQLLEKLFTGACYQLST